MPELVPQPRGGALLSGGIPGHRGGTGRPPDAWKALCRELASRDEMLEQARAVLSNREHPAWLGAWRFVAEQAYGKAEATQTVKGDVDAPLVIRVVAE